MKVCVLEANSMFSANVPTYINEYLKHFGFDLSKPILSYATNSGEMIYWQNEEQDA